MKSLRRWSRCSEQRCPGAFPDNKARMVHCRREPTPRFEYSRRTQGRHPAPTMPCLPRRRARAPSSSFSSSPDLSVRPNVSTGRREQSIPRNRHSKSRAENPFHSSSTFALKQSPCPTRRGSCSCQTVACSVLGLHGFWPRSQRPSWRNTEPSALKMGLGPSPSRWRILRACRQLRPGEFKRRSDRRDEHEQSLCSHR